MAIKDGPAGCTSRALFVGSFVRIFGGELLADSTIFTTIVYYALNTVKKMQLREKIPRIFDYENRVKHKWKNVEIPSLLSGEQGNLDYGKFLIIT